MLLAGVWPDSDIELGLRPTSPHTAKPSRPLRPQSTTLMTQQMPKNIPAPADRWSCDVQAVAVKTRMQCWIVLLVKAESHAGHIDGHTAAIARIAEGAAQQEEFTM